jgi:hypothetical protein
MVEFDDDGIPTGNYVKKIGRQYGKRRKELGDALRDEDNNPLEYVVKDNLKDYTKKEIAHNKKLRDAKVEFADFVRAERVYKGVRLDGEYHKYTNEFKAARSKFMVFRQGKWRMKKKKNEQEFQAFQTKYYEVKEFYKPSFTGNEFNGKVTVITDDFVKPEFTEQREISESGVDMRSSKYKKLMNPPAGNALAQAQKEFYEMYVNYFENDLLKKMPMHVNHQMNGRIPLVKETSLRKLKDSPSIVASLWAKVISIPTNTWNYFFN